MLREALRKGLTIQYRSSGWSLYPWVHSNDCCVFAPVTDPDQLKVGDVVFCEVQESKRHYAHMIHEIGWENFRDPFDGEVMFKRYFWIGNMKGHRNGWSYDGHIYGRLVEVIAPGEKGWEVE